MPRAASPAMIESLTGHSSHLGKGPVLGSESPFACWADSQVAGKPGMGWLPLPCLIHTWQTRPSAFDTVVAPLWRWIQAELAAGALES
eukprot:scaffold293_cov267-Prasinococcus_capsulatus_cf.AAC.12